MILIYEGYNPGLDGHYKLFCSKLKLSNYRNDKNRFLTSAFKANENYVQ